jgi:hypothetical protein
MIEICSTLTCKFEMLALVFADWDVCSPDKLSTDQKTWLKTFTYGPVYLRPVILGMKIDQASTWTYCHCLEVKHPVPVIICSTCHKPTWNAKVLLNLPSTESCGRDIPSKQYSLISTSTPNEPAPGECVSPKPEYETNGNVQKTDRINSTALD